MSKKLPLHELRALAEEQRNNRGLSDRLVSNLLTLTGITEPHPEVKQAFKLMADRLTGNLDWDALRSEMPTQFENGEGASEHLEIAYLAFDGFNHSYCRAHPEVHDAVGKQKELLESMQSTAARMIRISCPDQVEGSNDR